MTPLDKTLKRSLCIKGIDYVVTLSPDTLKLTQKGRRLGMELKWADITSGESALAVALHASVGRFEPRPDRKRSKKGEALQREAFPKKPGGTKAASARARRPARGLPTERSR
jgi:hypothetical protein